jgi:hypothetical protein
MGSQVQEQNKAATPAQPDSIFGGAEAGEIGWAGAGWIAAGLLVLVPAIYSVVLHGLALTGFVCLASSENTRGAIVSARNFVSVHIQPLATKLCGERKNKE